MEDMDTIRVISDGRDVCFTGLAVSRNGEIVLRCSRAAGFLEQSVRHFRSDGLVWVMDTDHEPRVNTGIEQSNGEFYLAAANYYSIEVYREDRSFIRKFDKKADSLPGFFAVANDHLFAPASVDHMIQVFGSDGTWVREWGSMGQNNGQFYSPRAVAIFEHQVFVTDLLHRVQVFGWDGTFLRTWSLRDHDKVHPFAIAVSPEGEVHVADYYHIQVFSPDGVFLRQHPVDFSGLRACR